MMIAFCSRKGNFIFLCRTIQLLDIEDLSLYVLIGSKTVRSGFLEIKRNSRIFLKLVSMNSHGIIIYFYHWYFICSLKTELNSLFQVKIKVNGGLFK